MRPSAFKKGGGFLDNVDVELKDYQWTDEFNGEPFKAGKIKDRNGKQIDKPHSLNLFLTVRVDGAEEDTTTTLKAAGEFDNFVVSDDGYELTAADEGECNIGAKSATGKFLQSLVEAGFPDTNFSDDPNVIDLRPMLNTKVRLVQRTDAERTKEFGKKKGKDGKEYDRKDLVVDSVLELPESKSSKSGSTKSKGKAVEADDDDDVEQIAVDTLKKILSNEKGESIAKNKLSVKVLTALGKHPQREAVRKLLGSDEFLSGAEGISYAKGIISLDE